jgi:hypothetical protein
MLASPGFTGEGLGLILGDRQATVIATLEPTGVRGLLGTWVVDN